MSTNRSLKAFIKRLLPGWALRLKARLSLARSRKEFAALSVEETFRRIYADHLWGEGLNSGSGSDPAAQAAYIDFVRGFIASHGIQTVVDLGCGDFRIGQQIAPGVRYLGLDIVPEVIERNRQLYGSDSVSFAVANILEDGLPAGDLCLLRQVLQHLSNAEIQAALGRLSGFRFALVSEHVPLGSFTPNRDKPHGPDIRFYDHSGVVLDAEPFCWPCRVVLESPLDDKSRLRTWLIGSGSTATANPQELRKGL